MEAYNDNQPQQRSSNGGTAAAAAAPTVARGRSDDTVAIMMSPMSLAKHILKEVDRRDVVVGHHNHNLRRPKSKSPTHNAANAVVVIGSRNRSDALLALGYPNTNIKTNNHRAASSSRRRVIDPREIEASQLRNRRRVEEAESIRFAQISNLFRRNRSYLFSQQRDGIVSKKEPSERYALMRREYEEWVKLTHLSAYRREMIAIDESTTNAPSSAATSTATATSMLFSATANTTTMGSSGGNNNSNSNSSSANDSTTSHKGTLLGAQRTQQPSTTTATAAEYEAVQEEEQQRPAKTVAVKTVVVGGLSTADSTTPADLLTPPYTDMTLPPHQKVATTAPHPLLPPIAAGGEEPNNSKLSATGNQNLSTITQFSPLSNSSGGGGGNSGSSALLLPLSSSSAAAQTVLPNVYSLQSPLLSTLSGASATEKEGEGEDCGGGDPMRATATPTPTTVSDANEPDGHVVGSDQRLLQLLAANLAQTTLSLLVQIEHSARLEVMLAEEAQRSEKAAATGQALIAAALQQNNDHQSKTQGGEKEEEDDDDIENTCRRGAPPPTSNELLLLSEIEALKDQLRQRDDEAARTAVDEVARGREELLREASAAEERERRERETFQQQEEEEENNEQVLREEAFESDVLALKHQHSCALLLERGWHYESIAELKARQRIEEAEAAERNGILLQSLMAQKETDALALQQQVNAFELSDLRLQLAQQKDDAHKTELAKQLRQQQEEQRHDEQLKQQQRESEYAARESMAKAKAEQLTTALLIINASESEGRSAITDEYMASLCELFVAGQKAAMAVATAAVVVVKLEGKEETEEAASHRCGKDGGDSNEERIAAANAIIALFFEEDRKRCRTVKIESTIYRLLSEKQLKMKLKIREDERDACRLRRNTPIVVVDAVDSPIGEAGDNTRRQEYRDDEYSSDFATDPLTQSDEPPSSHQRMRNKDNALLSPPSADGDGDEYGAEDDNSNYNDDADRAASSSSPSRFSRQHSYVLPLTCDSDEDDGTADAPLLVLSKSMTVINDGGGFDSAVAVTGCGGVSGGDVSVNNRSPSSSSADGRRPSQQNHPLYPPPLSPRGGGENNDSNSRVQTRRDRARTISFILNDIEEVSSHAYSPAPSSAAFVVATPREQHVGNPTGHHNDDDGTGEVLTAATTIVPTDFSTPPPRQRRHSDKSIGSPSSSVRRGPSPSTPPSSDVDIVHRILHQHSIVGEASPSQKMRGRRGQSVHSNNDVCDEEEGGQKGGGRRSASPLELSPRTSILRRRALNEDYKKLLQQHNIGTTASSSSSTTLTAVNNAVDEEPITVNDGLPSYGESEGNEGEGEEKRKAAAVPFSLSFYRYSMRGPKIPSLLEGLLESDGTPHGNGGIDDFEIRHLGSGLYWCVLTAVENQSSSVSSSAASHWLFYNDNISLCFDVEMTCGPQSELVALGKTIKRRARRGVGPAAAEIRNNKFSKFSSATEQQQGERTQSCTFSVRVYPGDTEPFWGGVTRGYSSQFTAVPIGDGPATIAHICGVIEEGEVSVRAALAKLPPSQDGEEEEERGGEEEEDGMDTHSNRLLAQCVAANTPFIDTAFPPMNSTALFRLGIDTYQIGFVAPAAASSLVSNKKTTMTHGTFSPRTKIKGVINNRAITWCPTHWLRPSQFLPSEAFHKHVVKFRDIEPNDIDQGKLGDCWVLASIAALAEYPDRIERLFNYPKTTIGDNDSGQRQIEISNSDTYRGLVKAEEKLGAYRITLNVNGWWTNIIVDDYLPTIGGVPCFARNREDPAELWPSLIEKAFAKIYGSYSAIWSGDAAYSLPILTGFPSICNLGEIFAKTKYNQRISDAFFNKFLLERCGGRRHRSNDSDDNASHHTSSSSSHRRHLAVLSTLDFTEQRKPYFDAVGLTLSHSYSLIDVASFPIVQQPFASTSTASSPSMIVPPPLQLCKIRNPWGNEQEWNGEWSDTCPNWADPRYAHVRAALSPTLFVGDGTFWMSFSDVKRYFGDVALCPYEEGWYDYRVKGVFGGDSYSDGSHHGDASRRGNGRRQSRYDGDAHDDDRQRRSMNGGSNSRGRSRRYTPSVILEVTVPIQQQDKAAARNDGRQQGEPIDFMFVLTQPDERSMRSKHTTHTRNVDNDGAEKSSSSSYAYLPTLLSVCHAHPQRRSHNGGSSSDNFAVILNSSLNVERPIPTQYHHNGPHPSHNYGGGGGAAAYEQDEDRLLFGDDDNISAFGRGGGRGDQHQQQQAPLLYHPIPRDALRCSLRPSVTPYLIIPRALEDDDEDYCIYNDNDDRRARDGGSSVVGGRPYTLGILTPAVAGKEFEVKFRTINSDSAVLEGYETFSLDLSPSNGGDKNNQRREDEGSGGSNTNVSHVVSAQYQAMSNDCHDFRVNTLASFGTRIQ